MRYWLSKVFVLITSILIIFYIFILVIVNKNNKYLSRIITKEAIPVKNNEIKVMETTLIKNQWNIIWEDDFSNEILDTKKWTRVNSTAHHNNELQDYNFRNVTLKDGYLHLIAIKDENGQYTSGKVDTLNKFEISHGKVEVKMKSPLGKGLFPAVWLLNKSNTLPEIDIVEILGDKIETIYGVMHYKTNDGITHRTFNTTTIDNPEDFHIYSLEWKNDKISWLVDGIVYHEFDGYIPKDSMYLIINLAVGGDWPKNPDNDTKFPSSLIIDYVKVYQWGY